MFSCKNDDADDLSDRRLDRPVKEALVSECSELPEERDGDSRERSEADRLGAGDLIESLCSEEILEMRSCRTLAAI